MTPRVLLAELEAAGIRLTHAGDDLLAQIRLGSSLAPFRDRIRQCKPLLLAVFDLQAQIVAAATVEPSTFDRAAYDALWRRWHALVEQQCTA